MPVIPAVMLGVAAAGTAISAIGSASAGAKAQSAANLNAQEAVNSANNTLQSGAIAETQQRYQDRVVLAQQRASFGSSGVVATTGSPLDTMAASTNQAEQAALTVRRNYRLQAQQELEGAQADVVAGQNAKAASDFNVAGTLLTGGVAVANKVGSLIKLYPGASPGGGGGGVYGDPLPSGSGSVYG